MRVIDQQDHGPRRRGLDDKPKRCHRHTEEIRSRVISDAERGIQRSPLRLRQPAPHADDGKQELVQRGEPELGLGLDPRRAQRRRAERDRSRARVVKQRRLADPWLSADDQDAALRRESIEDRIYGIELGFASDQLATGCLAAFSGLNWS